MIANESASESEEGENYFVSMTDMMVGVLFIFIILLMIFALDFRTKTDVQDNAIDVAREVGRRLDDLQKDVKAEIATMDRSQETRRKLLMTLKSELKVDGMDVLIDEANGVLRLTEAAVQFETSQSILLDRYKFNVGKIARVLERVIPDYVACRIAAGQNRCRTGLDSSIETIFIEGHRFDRGEGRRVVNWQLSAESRSTPTGNHHLPLRSLRNTRNRESLRFGLCVRPTMTRTKLVKPGPESPHRPALRHGVDSSSASNEDH
jgi:hypothetical protein